MALGLSQRRRGTRSRTSAAPGRCPAASTTSSLRAPTVRPTRAPNEKPAIQIGSPGACARRKSTRRAHVVLLAHAFVVAAGRCADAAKVEAQRRHAARRPAPSPRGRRRCCSSSRRRADADGTRPPRPRPSSPRAGSPRGVRARRELKLDRTATARADIAAQHFTTEPPTPSNRRGVGRRTDNKYGHTGPGPTTSAIAPNAAAVPPSPHGAESRVPLIAQVVVVRTLAHYNRRASRRVACYATVSGRETARCPARPVRSR